MKKTINIENQPIEVNSSMGWLFIYREHFGHDILPDILPLCDAFLEALIELYGTGDDGDIISKLNDVTIEKILIPLSGIEMTTIINIFWAMAKNADPYLAEPKTWVNKFDVFPIDEIVVEIFTLIIDSSISSKNSQSLQAKLKEIRSSSMNSSLLEREED